MSLEATYNLLYGCLLLVLAAFMALPAWKRWTRNLRLARTGFKTQGHYHGKGMVVFPLENDRTVEFATWRRRLGRTNVGDALPVLYDPTDPSVAEVMRRETMWTAPLSNLTGTLALVLQATWLFLGMNLAVSVPLSLLVSMCSFVLANLALSAFYPPSRLDQFAEKEHEQGKILRYQRRRGLHRLAERGYAPALFSPEQEMEERPSIEEAEPPTMEYAPLTDRESETVMKSPPPSAPRGRTARKQLLRDMMSLEDEA